MKFCNNRIHQRVYDIRHQQSYRPSIKQQLGFEVRRGWKRSTRNKTLYGHLKATYSHIKQKACTEEKPITFHDFVSRK